MALSVVAPQTIHYIYFSPHLVCPANIFLQLIASFIAKDNKFVLWRTRGYDKNNSPTKSNVNFPNTNPLSF